MKVEKIISDIIKNKTNVSKFKISTLIEKEKN